MDTSHFVCPDCDCTKTGCASGYACDTLTKKCTAVSCSAVGACPAESKCVADDLIRCVRAPCPGFRCEGPAEGGGRVLLLLRGQQPLPVREPAGRLPGRDGVRERPPDRVQLAGDVPEARAVQLPDAGEVDGGEADVVLRQQGCGVPGPRGVRAGLGLPGGRAVQAGAGDGRAVRGGEAVREEVRGGRALRGAAWFPFDCILDGVQGRAGVHASLPHLMDAPSTCQKPCTSHADCDADHECKAAFVKESCGGARTCKKRAGRGQRCGGFTPFDCLVQSCQPGLKCTWPAGLTDAPGTCQ
eukprot:Sspe_Gene.32741::Locus_16035_Transcript_1_4_Confidence_0.400_Length_1303::g.32741::m.32741